MADDSGTLTVDGARLEYTAHGGGAGVPVLLLHEGLGSVSTWRDFPARLAAASGRRVIAYSRQGYGGSDPVRLPRPLDYMSDEAVRVLPQVLDRLGLTRVALVGHSDGASIAAIHAGRVDRGRVAALVLMAPHFFTEEEGLESIRAARREYEEGGLREALARHHGDNVEGAFRGWNDAWLDPGFVDWNIEDSLDGIAVPLLVLQGRDDQYGTLAQVEAVRARCPGPVEVALFEACGHAPHRDQPQLTVDTVAGFLARSDRLVEA